MDANDQRWYAIQVRSRFEKKVHSQLFRKDIECYLPLIEEIRIWSDRRKRVQEPLFRGYVFVRINLKDKLKVLKGDGVVKFIGIKDKPSVIPDDQINWIKVLLNSGDAIRRESHPVLGDRVEVLAGPLRGVRGKISQVRGSTRLVVLVDAISRAFSVEVQPELLKIVSSQT